MNEMESPKKKSSSHILINKLLKTLADLMAGSRLKLSTAMIRCGKAAVGSLCLMTRVMPRGGCLRGGVRVGEVRARTGLEFYAAVAYPLKDVSISIVDLNRAVEAWFRTDL